MTAPRLAVIAGDGLLPELVLRAAGPDTVLVRLEGGAEGAAVSREDDLGAAHRVIARVEQLGALFDALRGHDVRQVVMAGAMQRPHVDPALLDATTAKIMPDLMAAMAGGDDALLRMVIGIFERQGFAVRGVHEIVADLTLPNGRLCGPAPSEGDRRDAARGRSILSALGPADVGQGAVVAGGLCLGLETAQGTDAMLEFVAGTRGQVARASGGVFVKRAKPGQDLRVDMPAIGPLTVEAAVRAGLHGICIQTGAVLVLDRAKVLSRADEAGVAIWAEP